MPPRCVRDLGNETFESLILLLVLLKAKIPSTCTMLQRRLKTCPSMQCHFTLCLKFPGGEPSASNVQVPNSNSPMSCRIPRALPSVGPSVGHGIGGAGGVAGRCFDAVPSLIGYIRF